MGERGEDEAGVAQSEVLLIVRFILVRSASRVT